MARDRLLPARLHAVHTRYQTPGNAILLQAVWTTILLIAFYSKYDNPRDIFDAMTDSVIFGGIIFYGLTVSAVYVLRRTRPALARPYRTWGYPITPALMLLTYVAAAVSVLGERPEETKYIAALIGVGIVYYVIVRKLTAAAAER
jgi:APA family basic amino acid/polyamine antiporter